MRSRISSIEHRGSASELGKFRADPRPTPFALAHLKCTESRKNSRGSAPLGGMDHERFSRGKDPFQRGRWTSFGLRAFVKQQFKYKLSWIV